MANRFYGRMGKGAGKTDRIKKRKEAEHRQRVSENLAYARQMGLYVEAEKSQLLRDYARLHPIDVNCPQSYGTVMHELMEEMNEGYIR